MNIKETFRVIEVNIKILQNKPNSRTCLKMFKLHFLENEVSNEKQNSILYLRLISPPRIMVPTWSYHPVTRHPVYTNRDAYLFERTCRERDIELLSHTWSQTDDAPIARGNSNRRVPIPSARFSANKTRYVCSCTKPGSPPSGIRGRSRSRRQATIPGRIGREIKRTWKNTSTETTTAAAARSPRWIHVTKSVCRIPTVISQCILRRYDLIAWQT